MVTSSDTQAPHRQTACTEIRPKLDDHLIIAFGRRRAGHSSVLHGLQAATAAGGCYIVLLCPRQRAVEDRLAAWLLHACMLQRSALSSSYPSLPVGEYSSTCTSGLVAHLGSGYKRQKSCVGHVCRWQARARAFCRCWAPVIICGRIRPHVGSPVRLFCGKGRCLRPWAPRLRPWAPRGLSSGLHEGVRRGLGPPGAGLRHNRGCACRSAGR